MQSFAGKVKTSCAGRRCSACAAHGPRPTACCSTAIPSAPRRCGSLPRAPTCRPAAPAVPASLRSEIRPSAGGGAGKLIFGITDRSKLDRIINQLGYDPRQNLVLHVNFGLLEDECCRTAFLRGAFLAGGSVTDPEKRYHLELDTGHAQASREVAALLTEMGFSAPQRPPGW